MKITLFSSNQPRHQHLARTLSQVADTVFHISEVTTVFPGKVDDFFKRSAVMQTYFSHVMAAETKIFGDIGFLPGNVKTLPIKMGDLNKLSREQLAGALDSDVYVVFGASYIKGWLIDLLVERQALNIHMGLSPYYRGSSCNFWALYDGHPGHVGATIHMLSKGLDSGDMLFHCVPNHVPGDTPFDFTMRSVAVAHGGLVDRIGRGDILTLPRVKQDRSQEMRYTRNADFTDEVAAEFLARHLDLRSEALQRPELLNPVFG